MHNEMPQWPSCGRNGDFNCIIQAFCIPVSICNMVARLERPVPKRSMITNHLIPAHLNQPWLSRDSLCHFTAAIHDEGTPLENCCGFIDGTVRPLCKPDQNQRILYNGHKRVHAGDKFSVRTCAKWAFRKSVWPSRGQEIR